jgi:hypothetical protein
MQVRGLIVQDGQGFLIFKAVKAAWRQQDQAARDAGGCHRPGTTAICIHLDQDPGLRH